MRTRVLIASPFPPRLDAPSGGARSVAGLLVRLAERCDVALIHLRGADEAHVDADVAAACDVVEEVPRERIGRSPRRAWRERRRISLILRGVDPWIVGCAVASFPHRLRRLVAAWRPEVVQLEFGSMLQYLPALGGAGCATVLVEHDPRLPLASLDGLDAVVVFTEPDRALLARRTSTPVYRIPLAVEAPPTPLDPIGADPPSLLFVGNFSHEPNVDAARRLAHGILPGVRERCPDTRLVVVGPAPPDDLLNGDGVSVTGLVPDVRPYLGEAAVVVAPLRRGGGMRVKVLEALAAGKALVATALAVEGTGAVAGEHYLRGETDEDLVEAVVGLLQRPDERAALGTRAATWAAGTVGWEATVAEYLALYGRLVGKTR